MIHQSKPPAKRAGMAPSRNYTLFDILLALAETPQLTPIHRCAVLRCVFLPTARK